jgi:hypothetical protein
MKREISLFVSGHLKVDRLWTVESMPPLGGHWIFTKWYTLKCPWVAHFDCPRQVSNAVLGHTIIAVLGSYSVRMITKAV